jgi:hypothetical protein
MSKKWMLAGAVGCGACVVLAARGRRGGKERPKVWDKMRDFMDDMPEDFPPRIMFDNLAATRENTERILEILETCENREAPSQKNRAADES